MNSRKGWEMCSASRLKDSSLPFVDVIESLCFCLDKDILEYALIKELINGTLDEKLFRFFLTQQVCLWHEISQQLIAKSSLKHTPYSRSFFLKIANFSLIEADNLDRQLDDCKISSYEITPVCKAYINFLDALEEKFLFLTAILPRFWLKAKLYQRIVKLNSFKHPYKRYIKYCLYHDAREPIIRIIDTLNTQFRTISKEEIPKIQQVVLEAAAHECELLNEAYSLVAI